MSVKLPDDVRVTGTLDFQTQPKNISPHAVYNTDYTVWDDLRVPLNTTRKGEANKPTFDQVLDDGSGSVGVYGEKFDPDTRQDVFFTIQMPHGFSYGTTIRPHIHWMPLTDDSGNVVFEFEYTLADIGNPFDDTITDEVTVPSGGNQYEHKMTYFADITPNFESVSGMWICRVSRKADDAADTYSGDVCIIEFDLHLQFDQPGSRQETEK